MLTMLNMKVSPIAQGHDSSWFNEPWKVEQMILSIQLMFHLQKPLHVKMVIVECFEIVLMKNQNLFHVGKPT